MLCTTVFTSCRFAVVLLFFAALPAHASRFGSSGAIGRAASKPVGALSSINKGGLHLRQQAYAPGDPQYLADVVGRVCNTVSPDLLNICVTDVSVQSIRSYCWEMLTPSGLLLSKIRQCLTAPSLRMNSPFVWLTNHKTARILRFHLMAAPTSRESRSLNGSSSLGTCTR